MPDFTPAVETLLRTIAACGDKGATFARQPGNRYRLTGTNYRVAGASFLLLMDEAYIDAGDDTAPVKLTAKGRRWMEQHPVPRGSRGPYRPQGARNVSQAPAASPARLAYGGGFIAELVERTVVITCPSNDRGGATLPALGWEQRAIDAHPTLYDIEGPVISGAYALRWREDPRSDAELLALSIKIARAEIGRD